jgi:hypothetical protein
MVVGVDHPQVADLLTFDVDDPKELSTAHLDRPTTLWRYQEGGAVAAAVSCRCHRCSLVPLRRLGCFRPCPPGLRHWSQATATVPPIQALGWSRIQAASDGSIAALLGIAGVHLALAAGYRSGLGDLGRVPVVELTVTAVYDAASVLLRRVNGVARTLSSDVRPVGLAGRFNDERGRQHQVVLADSAEVRARANPVTVMVGGEQPPPPPAPGPGYVQLAQSHPDVAEVLDVLGTADPAPDWSDPYKVHEIMLANVPGFYQRGWVTRDQMSTTLPST